MPVSKPQHDLSDLDHMSFDEIDEIVHSEHVTAEQLDLLAAHTKRANNIRREELKALDEQMARIEARLNELKR